MLEHHIAVERTARYVTLGDAVGAPRQVWFVCHGYGQLAARFARHFAELASGGRLVVAPEALSRFYVEPAVGGSHADRRVGASWMTREDRLGEIADYVRYLDAVHARVLARLAPGAPDVAVLGFSQGTATASRWVAMGAVRPSRLVLWAGLLPPDLPASAVERLRTAGLTFVRGSADAFASAPAAAEQEAWLREQGIPFRAVTFDGGHRLDADVLRRLAAEA